MSDVPSNLPNPNAEGQELEPEQSVLPDAESLARHFEQDDVDVRGIVRFGIIIGVAAVVAGTVLAIALRVWTAGPLPVQFQVPPALVTPPPVSGPGLDAVPETNLESYLLREEERLYQYGWVDRDAGVVHIPIEEAMRLLVEQGVPAREGDAPTFKPGPSFQLDASGGLEPAGEEGFDDDASGDSGNTTSGDAEDGAEGEDGGDASGDESSEEPGGSEAGDDAAGEDSAEDEEPSDGEAGNDNAIEDEGTAPGSIAPEDEDAGDEEPGGSQSGG